MLSFCKHAVGFGDLGHIRGSMDGPLCPLMIYCSERASGGLCMCVCTVLLYYCAWVAARKY